MLGIIYQLSRCPRLILFFIKILVKAVKSKAKILKARTNGSKRFITILELH